MNFLSCFVYVHLALAEAAVPHGKNRRGTTKNHAAELLKSKETP